MNGISPIGYFAVSAGGMTLAALIAARLAGAISTRIIILAGQIAALAAGIVTLIGAVRFDTPALVIIVCFLVLMSAQGLITPAAAHSPRPEYPTTPVPDPLSSTSSNGSPQEPSPPLQDSAVRTPRSRWPSSCSPAPSPP